MKYKILIVALTLLLVFSLSEAIAQITRIMPLGDSLTVGAGQITDNNYRVSYRQSLWLNLAGGGYSVDFVGSQTSGLSAIPDFDASHEGHGGYTASQVAGNVYSWLQGNPADIVLLHIGTNDIGNGTGIDVPTLIGRIENILNAIDDFESDYSTEITVVLAQIIDQKIHSTLTSEFNWALKDFAVNRQIAGDRIILVDMEHALVYPDDMYDTYHPTSAGYDKMADMWLNELEVLLSRQLIVEKVGTGQGTITSLPSVIDCGSSCNATMPQWTDVTLTATADYGNAFLEWTGCDSVTENVCTVTLDNDRTVTAAFRLVDEVTVLSPKGGDTIQTGSLHTIRWEAPPGATTFKLSASPGGKIGTVSLANETVWEVPIVKRNKTRGRVKITAYDDSGKKIGTTKTESFFTIEGVRITFPNEGDVCVGGETCTITWTRSEYVPAASARIFYSLKNGGSWKEIPEIVAADAGSFAWVAPIVSEPQGKCKIKIILNDINGRAVGLDKSDGVFTIQPFP